MVQSDKTNGKKLTRKDFQSNQEVRWCPGCGDYVILATVQKLLPELGIPRHNFVFVSGIGCSSRFPYYVETFGFHTIHGRAPAIATGIKLANPELTVWIATGDGDGLSIGGNHLAHVLRRNLDCVIMLFNNKIYGLTKGQASPTSELGKKTKSTPMGTVERPFNPLTFALGAGATFVARTSDTDPKHLQATLEAAQRHRGASFVEIMQNCPVFNDGAWDALTDKSVREDRVLYVENQKALRFGKGGAKGVRLNDQLGASVVDASSDDSLLVYDDSNEAMAGLLAGFTPPEMPFPVGVLYRSEQPTLEQLVRAQVDEAKAKRGPGDLGKLIRGSETWTVGGH